MTTIVEKRDWGFSGAVKMLYERVGFEPTGVEQGRILKDTARWKAVAGGEQSGKSLCASKEWLRWWAEDLMGVAWQRQLLYWLVAEDYERTRGEFTYIKEDMEKMGVPVESTKRVDPGYIVERAPAGVAPRFRVETKSSKDPRTLAMYAPDGIIICEASQVDLETFQKCLARLAPKKGRLFMAGTYEGSLGWWPGVIKGWSHGDAQQKSFTLPTPTNWHLYPGGVDDPEILRLKNNSSDAFFMERIMGIASPPKGLVFTEFRPDIHIRECPYVPGEPVYLWVDPGYAHAYAVECIQIVDGQVRVIDEVYERGLTTPEVVLVCKDREWWKDHSEKGVIDVGGMQHQAMAAPAEVWMSEAGVYMAYNRVRIADGIERFKTFLKVHPITGAPKVVFDPRCKGILSELGAYPDPFDGQTRVYAWKMDREGNVIGGEPEDRYNDGIKALTYGLVEHFGYVTGPSSQEFVMRRHGGNGHMERQSRFKTSKGRVAR